MAVLRSSELMMVVAVLTVPGCPSRPLCRDAHPVRSEWVSPGRPADTGDPSLMSPWDTARSYLLRTMCSALPAAPSYGSVSSQVSWGARQVRRWVEECLRDVASQLHARG